MNSWSMSQSSSSSISFKITKILSRFGFKVSFRPVNKIKFSSPKDPIPIENQSGIYFIPCSSCNLGYIVLNQFRVKGESIMISENFQIVLQSTIQFLIFLENWRIVQNFIHFHDTLEDLTEFNVILWYWIPQLLRNFYLYLQHFMRSYKFLSISDL